MHNLMLVGTLRMLKRAGELWQSLKIVEFVDGKGSGGEAWSDVGRPQGTAGYLTGSGATMAAAIDITEGKEPSRRVMEVLSESWRDHVPVPDFFESLELEATRRGIIWDKRPVNQAVDLMKRLRSLRDNMEKTVEYTAGGSRGGREADI